MSISACPSILPCTSPARLLHAAFTSPGLRNRRNSRPEQGDHHEAPGELRQGEAPASSDQRIRPSSSTKLVEANWKTMAEVKSPPCLTMEAGDGGSGVGAGRGCGAKARRLQDRAGARVGQQTAHLLTRDHRLDHARDDEAQDQRPEHLPAHRRRPVERPSDRRQHAKTPWDAMITGGGPSVQDGPSSTSTKKGAVPGRTRRRVCGSRLIPFYPEIRKPPKAEPQEATSAWASS